MTKLFGMLMGVSIILLLLACAPRAAPAPAPPGLTPPAVPAPAPAPAAAPPPSPEDIAWNKIVQEARKEGKVTAYSFYLIGDTGRAVAEAFRNRYGLSVEIITGIGSVLMERIRSERAARKYIADTLDTAPSFVLTFKEAGFTQAAGALPVLREKGVWPMPPMLEPEAHAYAINSSYTPPYFNNDLVKPGEEPRSYKAFLDPKWRGKLVVSVPQTDPLAVRVYVAGKKYGILEEDYWPKLATQGLKFVPSVRDGGPMLARGEVSIHFAASTAIMNPLIRDGAPIRPLEPEEGVVTAPGVTIAIVKDAPHPNAARLFISWLLTAEGQSVHTGRSAMVPIRLDVPDPSPLAGRVSFKKVLALDGKDELEVGRLQRGGVLDRLLGLTPK